MCSKKRLLGWVLSLVMIVSIIAPVSILAARSSLIADDLEQQELTTSLSVGDFLIAATAEKTVKIDSNSKVAEDGMSFSQRIKLGGSGNKDYRSIHFNATSETEVTVYAMSSSSSSDRKLALYDLSDNLLGEMDAPGSGLNHHTFTVEAGDYYLTSPSSGVNVYGVVLNPKALPPEVKTLGISNLTQEKLDASLEVNGFTLKATPEKTVTIDGNSKTAEDGTSYTQRLKLGGSGSADYRSVHFSVTADSTVLVYAMSSSSSSDRKLDLMNIDGTKVGEMDAPGAGLNSHTFNVGAGDYYLLSPSSGVNIYEVIVTTGEPVAVVRADWETVEAPVITDVAQNGSAVDVTFTLLTGTDGADKAYVTMTDSEGAEVEKILVGKSNDTVRTASFSIGASGSHSYQVEALRNDETTGKLSNVETFDYVLPLTEPVARAFNNLNGSVTVKWFAVTEATNYVVEYSVAGEDNYKTGTTVTGLEGTITGLTLGTTYDIRVKAVRGSDEAVSEVITKTSAAKQEREWNFTYFGQSVSSSRNVMEMIDEENLTFALKSCTIKSDGVTIDGKGGKFTTFHDGISYYYTVVDPVAENFELTATFTIDYINSTPDGQEGFGLLVMDSLGEHGVSSVNHYTNSAGILATKFEEVIDGVKYTGKDVIGSRFVSGITPDVLVSGDSAIAENGESVKSAYGYEPDDFVKTGESYTFTLKKTNTGYHVSMAGEEEHILYGVDKLLQLDPENLYVGFAVARGCNATVSDVTFTTSDPATDPPAEEEPAELVPYTKKIDSPTTSGDKDYTFVYVSDVPGTLSVTDSKGVTLVDGADIVAGVDYSSPFVLTKGTNTYSVAFTPDADFIPGENQVLDSYETVSMAHSVEYRDFPGHTIFVSPEGTKEAQGNKAHPVDVQTAIAYAEPGQIIRLDGGTYNITEALVVVRGVDGTASDYISLVADPLDRAVFDFSNAPTGMAIWGDYWYVENIDITNTPGNTKGLQIAGSNNVISKVNAYDNGDTGIQISGTSQETIEKWPANNLIINCTSYDNIDPGQNNADGFAAKITVGEGNVFRGCIAYNNFDDGWDLFAKIESGPIGTVVIEDCLAFNNGTLTDGTGNGDGNGFKLGGDGIAVPHVLRNSIAYNNNTTGITSNSNPAVVLENVTAYGNGRNIALYGKGDGSRAFVASGVLSMAGAADDNIAEMPELLAVDTYFSVGGVATNSTGATLDKSVFVSTNMNLMPRRDMNGSIDMRGLFEVKSSAIVGVGAVLSETVLTPPVDIMKGLYKVVSGDVLWKIAQKHGITWKELLAMNPDIKNPNRIFIGQLLNVPEQ